MPPRRFKDPSLAVACSPDVEISILIKGCSVPLLIEEGSAKIAGQSTVVDDLFSTCRCKSVSALDGTL